MTAAKQPILRPPLWKRVLDWLRDFDEAMHYDPVVELRQRVHRLETQIANLSKDNGGPTAAGSRQASSGSSPHAHK